MKRFFYLFVALLLPLSCQRETDIVLEEASGLNPERITTFYASVEEASPDTKVYADENLRLLWNADDRISIFNKSTYNFQFVFTGEDGDNAGGFDEIPPSGFISGNSLDNVYAVYPYASGNKINNAGSIITLSLPAEQAYREHSFGVGANTMVAATDGSFLAFKNVGGYLVLRLYGDDVSVSRVTLQGNNGEKIAGKAKVSVGINQLPSVTMDGAATESVSVVCDPPVQIGSSATDYTEFWFVLPPVTFANGFTITVEDTLGGSFVKSTSKSFTITRSTRESMSALKVAIAPPKPFDAEYKFDGKIQFNCGDWQLYTTAQYMNEKIYNPAGMSENAFYAFYNCVDLSFVPAAGVSNIGTVQENYYSGINSLKWTISSDEIWANAGKDVVHYVKYYNGTNPNLYVVVKLVATIDDIQKSYNITKADYISNYWDDIKSATRYYVSVPTHVGDSDPGNCIFFNDINAPFVTWPAGSTEGVPGVLRLAPSVTNIQYYFCKADTEKIADLKVNGKRVSFSVKADGLELYAKTSDMLDAELIAWINNTPWTIPANTIELNKYSELAKALLNVDKSYLYVLIGAKGNICDDDTKEVTITFDGKDHFRANYVRPVDLTDISKDKFIDGVDYGETGSYISVEDLVVPKDWRGRAFIGDYITYWDFYGPFNVIVDLDDVECDLNGKRQLLPATIELRHVSTNEMQLISGDTTLNSKYGYITYRNNGFGIMDFNIFLEVLVEYGWGVIVPDHLTRISVSSTIGY